VALKQLGGQIFPIHPETLYLFPRSQYCADLVLF
jgi:hypothetical protein